MAQQVHDGHRPTRWDKFQYGRSVSRGRTDAYLHVGKRGNEFGHGIGEREFVFGIGPAEVEVKRFAFEDPATKIWKSEVTTVLKIVE